MSPLKSMELLAKLLTTNMSENLPYLILAVNVVLAIIGYLLHRSISHIDTKLSQLETHFHDHKIDDNSMAVDIAKLTTSKEEHLRSLGRLEDKIERLYNERD